MADAGGAVYLLSSYQRGRQRRRRRGGGGGREQNTKENESHDKREHLVPLEISVFASLLHHQVFHRSVPGNMLEVSETEDE